MSKKRTYYTIDHLKKHAIELGGLCLSDEYKNEKHKYNWICKEKHIWTSSWGPTHIGKWCPDCGIVKSAISRKKYTIEDLKKYAQEKGGDCLSEVYLNDKTHYKWINHKNNNIWEAKWNCVLKDNTWCPLEGKDPKRLLKNTIQDLKEYALLKKGLCLSTEFSGQMNDSKWQCEKGHQWEANFNNVKFKDSWCPYCVHTVSKPHQEIIDFIKTVYTGEMRINDREAIKPLELDIYIPEFKLGIEFDGLYWHNETTNPDAKKKNMRKVVLAKENNINFLAIFEDEWNNPTKQELIKEMIKYRLKIAPIVKLRASKLELRKLDNNKQFKDFFAKFHLDGHTNASFAYGLFYNDILISCLSFRKSFADKSWEIARFANDYNYLVHGNGGRLIKEFKREFGERLITFSNNRLSVGNVYQQLGFKEITKTIDPSYYYTDLTQRIWRYKCKRINDPEIIAQYPSEKAQALGGVFSRKYLGHEKPLYKIYDYGHKKWELT